LGSLGRNENIDTFRGSASPDAGDRGLRDDLPQKSSRAMARKVVASLKSISGEAQGRGLVAQNAAQPVRGDVKKREQRKLAVGRDIPSKKEVRAVLAHVEGRWRPLLRSAGLVDEHA
jgi:hypothetical protein